MILRERLRERERDAIYRKKWDGSLTFDWGRERKRDILEARYNCHKNIIKEKYIEISMFLFPIIMFKHCWIRTLTQFSRGMFPSSPFFLPLTWFSVTPMNAVIVSSPFQLFILLLWENGGSLPNWLIYEISFNIGQHLNVKCVPHLFSPVSFSWPANCTNLIDEGFQFLSLKWNHLNSSVLTMDSVT